MCRNKRTLRLPGNRMAIPCIRSASVMAVVNGSAEIEIRLCRQTKTLGSGRPLTRSEAALISTTLVLGVLRNANNATRLHNPSADQVLSEILPTW